MFIGRESELGKLNKMYSGNKFECASEHLTNPIRRGQESL